MTDTPDSLEQPSPLKVVPSVTTGGTADMTDTPREGMMEQEFSASDLSQLDIHANPIVRQLVKTVRRLQAIQADARENLQADIAWIARAEAIEQAAQKAIRHSYTSRTEGGVIIEKPAFDALAAALKGTP